jgi:hypothetical protein
MPTGQLYTDFARQVKADSKRLYNFDYDAKDEEVCISYLYDLRPKDTNIV